MDFDLGECPNLLSLFTPKIVKFTLLSIHRLRGYEYDIIGNCCLHLLDTGSSITYVPELNALGLVSFYAIMFIICGCHYEIRLVF